MVVPVVLLSSWRRLLENSVGCIGSRRGGDNAVVVLLGWIFLPSVLCFDLSRLGNLSGVVFNICEF
jgi:hypothetical protein